MSCGPSAGPRGRRAFLPAGLVLLLSLAAAAEPAAAPVRPDLTVRLASLDAGLGLAGEIYDLVLPGMGGTVPRLLAARIGAKPANTGLRGLDRDRPVVLHASLPARGGVPGVYGCLLPVADLAAFRAGFTASSPFNTLALDATGDGAVLHPPGADGPLLAAWAALPDPGWPEPLRLRVSGECLDRRLDAAARAPLARSLAPRLAALRGQVESLDLSLESAADAFVLRCAAVPRPGAALEARLAARRRPADPFGGQWRGTGTELSAWIPAPRGPLPRLALEAAWTPGLGEAGARLAAEQALRLAGAFLPGSVHAWTAPAGRAWILRRGDGRAVDEALVLEALRALGGALTARDGSRPPLYARFACRALEEKPGGVAAWELALEPDPAHPLHRAAAAGAGLPALGLGPARTCFAVVEGCLVGTSGPATGLPDLVRQARAAGADARPHDGDDLRLGLDLSSLAARALTLGRADPQARLLLAAVAGSRARVELRARIESRLLDLRLLVPKSAPGAVMAAFMKANLDALLAEPAEPQR